MEPIRARPDTRPDTINTRPRSVQLESLDDNVCIAQIKKYFTFDGWSLLQNSIDTLLVHGDWHGDWTCSICCIDLSTSESIGCDSCLGWFHLKCVGLL